LSEKKAVSQESRRLQRSPKKYTGWAKNSTPTVSQQTVLQCVPIKLVLTDLTVTYIVSDKHIML